MEKKREKSRTQNTPAPTEDRPTETVAEAAIRILDGGVFYAQTDAGRYRRTKRSVFASVSLGALAGVFAGMVAFFLLRRFF